jgi:hypothetical protein
VCFSTSAESLTKDLEAALEEAFSRRNEWEAWGHANRRIFQDLYYCPRDSRWLVEQLLAVVSEKSSRRSG